MAKNEGEDDALRDLRTLDLRTLTMEQRAEWLARTLVDLADGFCDVRAAAEVVLESGWQPGAYAVLPGDMELGEDGEFRPATDAGLAAEDDDDAR